MLLPKPPPRLAKAQKKDHILVPEIDYFPYVEKGYKDISSGIRVWIGRIGYVIMEKQLPTERGQ